MTNKGQIKEDDKEDSITLFPNKKRANYYRKTYEEEIKKERAKSGKKNEEFSIEYNNLYASSENGYNKMEDDQTMIKRNYGNSNSIILILAIFLRFQILSGV